MPDFTVKRAEGQPGGAGRYAADDSPPETTMQREEALLGQPN